MIEYPDFLGSGDKREPEKKEEKKTNYISAVPPTYMDIPMTREKAAERAAWLISNGYHPGPYDVLMDQIYQQLLDDEKAKTNGQ